MSDYPNAETKAQAQYIRRLGKRSQITIPKKMVKHLSLNEGDQLRVDLVEERIIIEPVKIVPKDALYYKPNSEDEFITEIDIQQAAAEAEQDYKQGKLKTYSKADENITGQSTIQFAAD
jgi:antitoxin MazE